METATRYSSGDSGMDRSVCCRHMGRNLYCTCTTTASYRCSTGVCAGASRDVATASDPTSVGDRCDLSGSVSAVGTINISDYDDSIASVLLTFASSRLFVDPGKGKNISD